MRRSLNQQTRNQQNVHRPIQNENGILSRGKNVKHMKQYLKSYNPITIRPSDNECAICQENSVSPWVSLKICGHSFHSECINEWITYRSNCPYCRAEIDSQNVIISQNIIV